MIHPRLAFVTAKIFALAIIFTVSTVMAQPEGGVRGTITDATTGEALPGVNLVLEGTVLGTASAADGSFLIDHLKPGNYTLVASLLGYEKISRALTVQSAILTVDLNLAPKPVDIGEILVEDERVYSAASSRSVRKFDLQTRPNRSAQDMLQMAPGLIIAQHAGGGKAEQIFLRNFDADHGTDVALSVDGIPVNMVSHGHGQGYADMHFLIPDVVDGIDVHKGPYFAEYGNLATAGAVSFSTKDHLENNEVRVEGGEFGTSRITTLLQLPITTGGMQPRHQGAYFAGQFYRTDGPFDSPQDFQRFNLFGKFHSHLSANSELAFSASAFSSAWDATGQIPQRAVDRGQISRFGSIDDLEGGTTARQNINLQYTMQGANSSEFFIQSYFTSYNFKLFSNFTFFLDDPENGDMIEQIDDRNMIGFNSRYRFNNHFGNVWTATTIGGGYRADEVQVELWKSPDRIRDHSLVDSDISERNFFLWMQQEWIFSKLFRMQFGLRGDYFTFNVQDHLDGTPAGAESELPHASGFAQQRILSPKLNLVLSPLRNVDLFANFGSGFHSNDARNVVISKRISEIYRTQQRQGLSEAEISQMLQSRNFDPDQRDVETLPRANGAEFGARSRLSDRINISAALWYLHLEREYVYVGDAGTTELSDPTKRMGIDLEARVRLLPWMWADADVNISDGRIVDAPDGENNIPLAPNLTTTGGLTAIHPAGIEGSLRYRHISDRPANEDNSVVASGYTLVDVSLGYRLGNIKFLTTLENLFDADWNEAQFDTETLLRGETTPVSEIHFTPGNPRNIRFGISYLF